MSAEPDPEADYVGDAAEERAILCVACRQYHPLTREGVPECEHTLAEAKDISEAYMWLSSDAARYVTGIVLPVDAGMLAK